MVFRKHLAATLFFSAALLLVVPVSIAQVTDSTNASGTTQGGSNATSDQVTYESMISAFSDLNTGLTDFQGITDLTPERIQVVNVASLMSPTNEAEVGQAIAGSAQYREQLGGLVSNNSVLNEVLGTSNVDPANVVAVDVLDNGNVVVFYHDQAAMDNSSTPNGDTNSDQNMNQGNDQGNQDTQDGQDMQGTDQGGQDTQDSGQESPADDTQP